jgi:sensor domain CHASE-containing protein
MSFRAKTILIITVILIILVASIFTIFRGILIQEFASIEQDLISGHIVQINLQVNGVLDQLGAITEDWSRRDATSAFIQLPTPGYIQQTKHRFDGTRRCEWQGDQIIPCR